MGNSEEREDILKRFRRVNAIGSLFADLTVHVVQDGPLNIITYEKVVPWIVAGISIDNREPKRMQIEDVTICLPEHPVKIEVINPLEYDHEEVCPDGLPANLFINRELFSGRAIGARPIAGLIYARIWGQLPKPARSRQKFELVIDFADGTCVRTPLLLRVQADQPLCRAREPRKPLFPPKEDLLTPESWMSPAGNPEAKPRSGRRSRDSRQRPS